MLMVQFFYVGLTALGSSELYGDQFHIRVASPEYSGHCVSWDYPLKFTNATTNDSLSTQSSLFLIGDEYHRIIYFSGKTNFNLFLPRNLFAPKNNALILYIFCSTREWRSSVTTY